MKKGRLSLLAITLIALLSLTLGAVFAQSDELAGADKTQPATGSATTKNLRERIERVVEEKRDQIQGVLSEIDQQRRGVIGQVERITEESITISNHRGTQIIPLEVDQARVRLIRSGSEIEFAEVAVGNWILALGLMEENSFIPGRILVSESSFRPTTRSVAIGTLGEITNTTITIDQRAGGEVSYATNRNTSYQDLEGEEIPRTILASLAEGTQAIVAGSITNGDDDADRVRTAQLIRVLTIVGN